MVDKIWTSQYREPHPLAKALGLDNLYLYASIRTTQQSVADTCPAEITEKRHFAENITKAGGKEKHIGAPCAW